jgi:galactosyl transferase GMA12/MNN10 family
MLFDIQPAFLHAWYMRGLGCAGCALTSQHVTHCCTDERPASWSKILAVKHYLKDVDWVMWLDADTIITNPDIRLESLLPRSASGPDFVITVDGGGYNAGIWLMRRSEWSMAFLDRWWSMKQYIRVTACCCEADSLLQAFCDYRAWAACGKPPGCALCTDLSCHAASNAALPSERQPDGVGGQCDRRRATPRAATTTR